MRSTKASSVAMNTKDIYSDLRKSMGISTSLRRIPRSAPRRKHIRILQRQLPRLRVEKALVRLDQPRPLDAPELLQRGDESGQLVRQQLLALLNLDRVLAPKEAGKPVAIAVLEPADDAEERRFRRSSDVGGGDLEDWDKSVQIVAVFELAFLRFREERLI